jgi:hypothetical protein
MVTSIDVADVEQDDAQSLDVLAAVLGQGRQRLGVDGSEESSSVNDDTIATITRAHFKLGPRGRLQILLRAAYVGGSSQKTSAEGGT